MTCSARGGRRTSACEAGRKGSITTSCELAEIEVPWEDDEADADAWVSWFSWRKFLVYSGPGLLMSIAYLDPGNLESDLQQGAYTGFSQLWVLALAHIAGFLMQALSAKLGNVTGKHLAQVCVSELPGSVSCTLYLVTEAAVVCADVQAILGSAIALDILFHVPVWLGCVITYLDSVLLLVVDYFGVRKLEALFGVLVATMTACFLANYAADPAPLNVMVEGFVPIANKGVATTLIGIVGAVLMPHNLYLHSALVLSRNVDRSRRSQVREANRYCIADAGLCLLVCYAVNLAVVGSFAQNFFNAGCAALSPTAACLSPSVVQPGSALLGSCKLGGSTSASATGVCAPIGLRRAGDALESTLGHVGRVVWALGLLAAGQSSTLTGTYAGQFVMLGFINVNLTPGQRSALIRAIALIPAVLVAVMPHSSGKMRFDRLGEWLNVVQYLALPFAVIPLVLFTDSGRIMGEFRNGGFISAACWFVMFFMMLGNVYLVFSLTQGDMDGLQHRGFCVSCVALLTMGYFASLAGLVASVVRGNANFQAAQGRAAGSAGAGGVASYATFDDARPEAGDSPVPQQRGGETQHCSA